MRGLCGVCALRGVRAWCVLCVCCARVVCVVCVVCVRAVCAWCRTGTSFLLCACAPIHQHTLAGSGELLDMLRQQKAEHRLIAAICAAPVVVLQAHDLLTEVDEAV
jgi:hypothetical protein